MHTPNYIDAQVDTKREVRLPITEQKFYELYSDDDDERLFPVDVEVGRYVCKLCKNEELYVHVDGYSVCGTFSSSYRGTTCITCAHLGPDEFEHLVAQRALEILFES